MIYTYQFGDFNEHNMCRTPSPMEGYICMVFLGESLDVIVASYSEVGKDVEALLNKSMEIMTDHVQRSPYKVTNNGIIRYTSMISLGPALEDIVQSYPEVADELVKLLKREHDSAVEYAKQMALGLVSRI